MKHWLFLFLLIFTAWLNAQTGTVSHRMFTQQDGIELTEIHTMAIDNDGFLWIGGESLSVRTIIYNEEPLMIQRFNGRTFHSIPLPDYEDRIVGVGQFYKRDDGKFYIRAQQESGEILLLFDPYSVTFTRIAIDNSDESHFGMSHIFSFQDQE